MYIGTSIFLIAVGAVLAWAVTAEVAGIDVQTAGVILMVVGAIGLIVSLFEQTLWADAAVAGPSSRTSCESANTAKPPRQAPVRRCILLFVSAPRRLSAATMGTR